MALQRTDNKQRIFELPSKAVQLSYRLHGLGKRPYDGCIFDCRGQGVGHECRLPLDGWN